MIKILNLKLVILLEYQNIKTFSENAMFKGDLIKNWKISNKKRQ